MVLGYAVTLLLEMPNRHLYPDDRINLCLDVDMVIGCTVMSMIEMPDKHVVHRGAWCSDVL